MNSALDTTYGRAAIANAIKAQVAALTIPDPANPPDGTLPAFQNVQLFDVESLTDAFRYLIMSEQRACVIIMLDQQFAEEINQSKIVVTRMQPVALLISDRRLGDRIKALFGDPDDGTVPGAFALEELVRPAVTGQLLNSDSNAGKTKLIAVPMASNSLFLKDEDRQELTGRAAVMLELHCTGGVLEAQIGPGANL